MDDYLPSIYQQVREDYPDVAGALDRLGTATDEAGPLGEKERRLVRLGLAIGGAAEGAVRSNARKSLAAGATAAEIRHVALLAITTLGFPQAVAGLGWINEVLEAR